MLIRDRAVDQLLKRVRIAPWHLRDHLQRALSHVIHPIAVEMAQKPKADLGSLLEAFRLGLAPVNRARKVLYEPQENRCVLGHKLVKTGEDQLEYRRPGLSRGNQQLGWHLSCIVQPPGRRLAGNAHQVNHPYQ